MPKIIEAIYEDGVLKPSEKLDIEEHQNVELIIKLKRRKRSTDLSNSVRDLIEILHGPLPVSSIEEMARDSEVDID